MARSHSLPVDLVKLALALLAFGLSAWTLFAWNVWFIVWITFAVALTVWLFLGTGKPAKGA